MIFWIASMSACDVLCLLPVYDTTYIDTSSISLISGQFGFEYYSRSLMSQFALHPRSSILLCCTTLTDFVLLILKCKMPFLSRKYFGPCCTWKTLCVLFSVFCFCLQLWNSHSLIMEHTSNSGLWFTTLGIIFTPSARRHASNLRKRS
jgi:hypothetical protein